MSTKQPAAYPCLDRIDHSVDEPHQPREAVDHPNHYHPGSGVEVIDAIEAWALGFNLGNVIKYVARADHKGKRSEDLQKALWYLMREISAHNNGDDAC